MSLEERTREWIHKPIFHGAPISWSREYFRGRLEKFRKEHKQFDVFLLELNKLIKSESSVDYINIEKFINGEAETNWISPSQGLFDMLIKLFNLCLSPKQAFDYIKECLGYCKEMLDSDYQLCQEPQISIRKSRWDGKRCQFISFSVKPKSDPKDLDNEYWFDITTSLNVIEENTNDITTHVDEFEFRCNNDKLKDTLMLFEYHQNKGLLRKIFNAGIKELETKGIIKEINQEDYYGWIIHRYETYLY